MKPEHVRKAVVAGAGVMGHSIAQVFARAGIETALVDVHRPALDRAMALIRSNLDTLVEHGSVSSGEIPSILGRILPGTDLAAAAADADFVLEAVSEVPEIKKEVFKVLSGSCRKEVVIASNTSGLDIFELNAVENPERLVVTHWFAPPHIIPLVEVVPGPKTSAGTVEFAAGLMKRIGKSPVVMKEFVRSFIVNRIQGYIAMAMYEILEKGWAAPEDVDLAVKLSLGVRLPVVGIVQSQDFTGLDLVLDVQKSYGACYTCVENRVKAGELGAKTSRGFYDYQGRNEAEILRKRDLLYLKTLDHMKELNLFAPV
jgi:3-hydroxybutyryl-CoA dehydrogenase